MAELFPVRTRFTGVGLSYQLASTLASGFAPLVATALVDASGGTTTLLATLMSVLALAGVAATVASRRLRIDDATSPVAPIS